jgi:hypothetical protein
MTVLHHMEVMKTATGCPKIILDAEMVMDVKLLFPGLHAHLTLSLLDLFCCNI